MTFIKDADGQYLNRDNVQEIIGSIAPMAVETRHNASRMWLNLPLSMKDEALARAGLDRGELLKVSAYPCAYFETPDWLAALLSEICIYQVHPATAKDAYYLEVTENKSLYVKYQTILGSRFLAYLTDADIEAIIAQMTAKLPEYVATHPKLKNRNVQAAPVAEGVAAELAMLTVSEGRVHLPTEHLKHYPKIKQLLEKAGGRYNSKGYFAFDAGIDCEAVLAQLMGGKVVNLKKDFQFFATPNALARQVCAAVGPLQGLRVLEPSAGDGAIADVALDMGAEVVVIEPWEVNVLKLQGKGYIPMARDFLSVTPEEIGQFDAIVANPPFTKNQDITHVLHMFKFLKPGGKLSVIMSPGWRTGSQKTHQAFRDFLMLNGASIEDVPSGTFSESGTDIATVRVTLQKAEAETLALAN